MKMSTYNLDAHYHKLKQMHNYEFGGSQDVGWNRFYIDPAPLLLLLVVF